MNTYIENLKEQINDILNEAGMHQSNLSSEVARNFITKNIIVVVEDTIEEVIRVNNENRR